MSDWKIGLTPASTKGTPTILGPLTAQLAWKRLSKPARAAVEAAYPDGRVVGHRNMLKALERHGFVTITLSYHRSVLAEPYLVGYLTDAGKAVAKWCVSDG